MERSLSSLYVNNEPAPFFTRRILVTVLTIALTIGGLPAAGTAGSARGATLLAYYPFEEGSGKTTADATGRNGSARLVGDAGFTEWGKYGLGMEFGGAGDWLDTGRGIIDTTHSYSVAVWISLADGFEADFRTAVSQDGERVSGFYLQYARPKAGPTSDTLRLTKWIGPSGEKTLEAHSSGRPDSPRWIHLAGVQDMERHRLQLYVDGRLVDDRPYENAGGAYEWPARGNTVIGRGLFNAASVDYFLGRIDEVYLFQGVLTSQEVQRIAGDKYLPNPPKRGTPDAVRDTVEITVDLRDTAGAISPLLFGHNLEHTRRAVWQGLGAELLANRKFAGRSDADGPKGSRIVRGQPGPDGVVARWYGIGKPDAHFAPDFKEYYAGRQSQRVSIFTGGAKGGLGQAGIPLKQDRSYAARLWLKADHRVKLTARLCDESVQKTYATEAMTLDAGDWREWTFGVTMRRTDPKARLEITFEGPGSLWLGAASLLPADNFHGMRGDVVGLLKQMKVSLLRWPGGNFTRDYRWKEGLLPLDRRPPTVAGFGEVLPFTENCDFHEIGTDEFIELCRHLGCEPCITVNLNVDATPPSEAAAWVEYCNGAPTTAWGRIRASRGHKEPYGVKYWSIGNEIWGPWMGPAHCDAATYARRVARYAAAMKKADPSIVLIASGQPGDWDKTVVAQAGGYFDHLSEHNYAPSTRLGPPAEMNREFARLGRYADTDVLPSLRGVRECIKAAAPSGRRIGIALDEWNVWHDWFSRPAESEWHVGPADAVYAASMLNMLCREAEPLGLSMAAFFQPANEGAIAVEPFSARLTGVGQVFELFAVHQRARLVKLGGAPGGGGADACASVGADNHLHVTLINRNPAKEQTVELAIAHAAVAGEPTARFLVAKDLRPDLPLEEKTRKIVAAQNGRLPLVVPRYGMVCLDVPLAAKR